MTRPDLETMRIKANAANLGLLGAGQDHYSQDVSELLAYVHELEAQVPPSDSRCACRDFPTGEPLEYDPVDDIMRCTSCGAAEEKR